MCMSIMSMVSFNPKSPCKRSSRFSSSPERCSRCHFGDDRWSGVLPLVLVLPVES